MIPKMPALGLDDANYRKRSCSTQRLERGDDSETSRHAPVCRFGACSPNGVNRLLPKAANTRKDSQIRHTAGHAVGNLRSREHDPEKWVPAFGKDHAPPKGWSGMAARRDVIALQELAAWRRGDRGG